MIRKAPGLSQIRVSMFFILPQDTVFQLVITTKNLTNRLRQQIFCPSDKRLNAIEAIGELADESFVIMGIRYDKWVELELLYIEFACSHIGEVGCRPMCVRRIRAKPDVLDQIYRWDNAES